MGAIAEGIVAYAQPLIDQTDGSMEQLNKAFTISQLCYNLALIPEEKRDAMLNGMQSSLQMDDQEFDEFRRSTVLPMIQRHKDMFPFMHQRRSMGLPTVSVSSTRAQPQPTMAKAAASAPVIDRYAPCPCKSGEKYKFCCGAKRR